MVRGNSNTYQVGTRPNQTVVGTVSGQKKALTIWLDEVDQLYETFKIKGHDGGPDTKNAYYRTGNSMEKSKN